MFQKLVSKTLILFLLLNFFSQTICEGNTAMSLSCMSANESIRYQTFKVRFYYSSRKQKHQLFTSKTIASENIDIDPTRKTIVIAHGLFPSSYLNLMNNLRDAFLRWSNVNVIYVDWEKGCYDPTNYPQAARNMEYTAIKIKNLFKNLVKIWNGTSKSKEHWGPLHFIGLSLGAHVVGLAAELLKDGDQPFVFRVTGLDPAEPCLDNADSPLRMRKSNAQYVDVIHTDGARTLNSGLGLFEPIGHVDFYVNGGSFQPGCTSQIKKRDINYFRLGYHLFLGQGRCHHLRSIELFTQSLKQAVSKKCKFWAHTWDSKSLYTNTPPRGISHCDETKCIEMGINSELYNHTNIIYYVAATGASPFCPA